MKTFNVRDYGALGNGTHNDTSAIQSAIAEIDANEEGILFFPDGKYLCGSLILCNNITITCNNAMLFLISDEKCLKHIPFGNGNRYGENRHIYFGFECNNNMGFLCAKDKENICIENIILEADDRSFCERKNTSPINYKKDAVLAPGAFFGDDHCYVPIKPRPQILKMWGVAEVCENANHAFGKPYNITLIGCENFKFSNCELLFRTPIFSNSFSQIERENIVKSIGQEYLEKIEPSDITPLSQSKSKGIDIKDLKVVGYSSNFV